jgi:hypothetical protein
LNVDNSLTQPKPTSFWDEAALRAQRESVRATWEEGKREEGKREEHKPLRREPPPMPTALVPTDDLLRLRLAEELEYARRLLAALGDELSADGAIVVRHGMALQSVDIVSQMLGHVASVVRSSDPDGAVERIGMCELKGRLKRQSIG